MSRSLTDSGIRRALIGDLDRLVGGSEWVGNKIELGYHINGASDYAALKVLKTFGEPLGRGQYRVTRKRFNVLSGVSPEEPHK